MTSIIVTIGEGGMSTYTAMSGNNYCYRSIPLYGRSTSIASISITVMPGMNGYTVQTDRSGITIINGHRSD